MGVPDESIKAFMRNPAFPLSVQTAFVENLGHLSSVPGSADVVTLANTAVSEDQARFLADAVSMLARYHQTQTSIAKITATGTVIGWDRNGAIVVEAPVDYVSWTERTSYFSHRPDLMGAKRSAWLSGQMSPLAKKNFQALGWAVHERAKL